jgi:hypothetical protein
LFRAGSSELGEPLSLVISSVIVGVVETQLGIGEAAFARGSKLCDVGDPTVTFIRVGLDQ